MQITRAGLFGDIRVNHSIRRTVYFYCPLPQTVRHPALRADPPEALLKITSLFSTVFRKLSYLIRRSHLERYLE
jgi:hypothetical protein